MSDTQQKRSLAFIFLLASIFFFVLGFRYPLLQSGYGIGPITLKSENIYLFSSSKFFFDKGEYFIGILLLFFTIIFPILKYVFLLLTIWGKRFPRHHAIGTVLEIINKWSMLDVFVVAVLILNLKFDSLLIISKLRSGTTLFAISVVLLMTSSFITRKMISREGHD